MKGIIWYKTFQQGCKQLDIIISNYELINIKPQRIRKSSYYYNVEFENGDEWNIASLMESSRGKCCNIGYIPFEMKTSKEAVAIAYPCIKNLPYQAIHFY